MSNTITAYFKGRKGVAESLYQNDYGMVMAFDGIELPAHFDCYFSIQNQEEAVPGVGADNRVAIPNSVLANPGKVEIHIPLHTGSSDSEVEYVVYFRVIGRARPVDDGTPAQMTAIEQALALLQNPITNIEQIVNEALDFTGDTFAEMQEQLDANQAAFQDDMGDRADAFEAEIRGDIADVESDFDNLNAQFQTAVGALTVDDELLNVRVGDDNVTYATAGEAVRKQFSALKSALNDIGELVNPPNRFNRLAVTAGYYEANGSYHSSTTYCYSELIPVESGKTYTFWAYSTQAGGIASTNVRFLTAYDVNKTAQTASGGTYVSSYTVPSGIKYICISIYQSQASADALFAMSEGASYVGGTTGSEYFPPYYKVTEKALANTVNTKHRVLAQNKGYSAEFSSLYGGNLKQDLYVEFDEMGGYDLVFNGDITTFTDVTFGIGYNEVYGCRIIVTPTNLTLYYNGAEQESFAHGLTFKDYINVDVKFYSNTTRADIFIDTNGGHYLKQYAVLACRKGHPFAVVSGTQISNSYLAVFCSNWNHKIWMYGDSYFNSGDPARWTHWLFARSKANNIMLDGYPGRDSQSALLSLKTAITMACPEKILWCLGMNNGDSGAINSDWLSAVNEVIDICDEYGIELILATIPNVPSVDNTYKNAYVRSSGRRYIDFASAVGASSDTTWYDGTLSGDNLHPTTEGAYALYRQAITDIPELNTQTELS